MLRDQISISLFLARKREILCKDVVTSWCFLLLADDALVGEMKAGSLEREGLGGRGGGERSPADQAWRTMTLPTPLSVLTAEQGFSTVLLRKLCQLLSPKKQVLS